MRWFDRIFRRSIYGELSQELSRCTEEKTEYGMQAVPRREFLKRFGLAATCCMFLPWRPQKGTRRTLTNYFICCLLPQPESPGAM